MSDRPTDRYDALGYWLAQRVAAERIHRRRVAQRQLQRTIDHLGYVLRSAMPVLQRVAQEFARSIRAMADALAEGYGHDPRALPAKENSR